MTSSFDCMAPKLSWLAPGFFSLSLITQKLFDPSDLAGFFFLGSQNLWDLCKVPLKKILELGIPQEAPPFTRHYCACLLIAMNLPDAFRLYASNLLCRNDMHAVLRTSSLSHRDLRISES